MACRDNTCERPSVYKGRKGDHFLADTMSVRWMTGVDVAAPSQVSLLSGRGLREYQHHRPFGLTPTGYVACD